LSSYEIALIGIAGTLLGTFVGALITYRLSVQLAKMNNRSDINKQLIHVFTTELADVYPTPVNWPADIERYLKEHFSNLQSAIGSFRLHLSEKERSSFDSAWLKYYCSTGREVDKNTQVYLDYISFTSTSDNGESTIDGPLNLRINIDNILIFATKT
jgi:hypothetical protein